ncbi:hypothetical protein PMAYCL1PPCAC_09350, partial [Pristionchus mayeri]
SQMFLSRSTILPLLVMGIVGITKAAVPDEILGQRTIKSYFGTFLHAVEYPPGGLGGPPNFYAGHADLADGPPTDRWVRWTIEKKDGKAVMRMNGVYNTNLFVSASHLNTIKLQPEAAAWEMWWAVKNTNGSWSFQGDHGHWLTARADKSVWQEPTSETAPGLYEQFELKECS